MLFANDMISILLIYRREIIEYVRFSEVERGFLVVKANLFLKVRVGIIRFGDDDK